MKLLKDFCATSMLVIIFVAVIVFVTKMKATPEQKPKQVSYIVTVKGNETTVTQDGGGTATITGTGTILVDSDGNITAVANDPGSYSVVYPEPKR